MSELRKDPVSGRWVITATRPQQKDVRDYLATRRGISGYCPFCEGSELETLSEVFAFRKPGTRPDTPGWRVRVIPNKYPLLSREQDCARTKTGKFLPLEKINGFGEHEIVVETPLHITTLHDLPPRQISIEDFEKVLLAYQKRIEKLKNDEHLKYVLIFRNNGYPAEFTVSHAHSQVIALPVVPKSIEEEIANAREYFKLHQRCLFCDLLKEELDSKQRIIYEGGQYVAFAPFASRFPFEVHIYPKQHRSGFTQVPRDDLWELATVLKMVLIKIIRLLENPPLNYVFHIGPLHPAGGVEEFYHWHIEIMPHAMPAQGLEWGGEIYLDPPAPETAAIFLRQLEVKI